MRQVMSWMQADELKTQWNDGDEPEILNMTLSGCGSSKMSRGKLYQGVTFINLDEGAPR